MYKITKPDGTAVFTEKPNFIRVHKNGCYLLTSREKAEGVAHGGTPYLFRDGAMCHEVDGGSIFLTIEEMAAAIREGVNEA